MRMKEYSVCTWVFQTFKHPHFEQISHHSVRVTSNMWNYKRSNIIITKILHFCCAQNKRNYYVIYREQNKCNELTEITIKSNGKPLSQAFEIVAYFNTFVTIWLRQLCQADWIVHGVDPPKLAPNQNIFTHNNSNEHSCWISLADQISQQQQYQFAILWNRIKMRPLLCTNTQINAWN